MDGRRRKQTSRTMSPGDPQVDLLQEKPKSPPNKWKKIQGAMLPAVVLGIIIALVIMLFIINREQPVPTEDLCKQDECRMVLVESIPENLTFSSGSPSHPSTYSAWVDLIDIAEHTINISAFYWSLRGEDMNVTDPSTWQGEDIFKRLETAAKQDGIHLNIAQNKPTRSNPSIDSEILGKLSTVEVRSLDFDRLIGSGILHTKFWVVDSRHFYVGSANMDFRSLTQVKELGVVVYNCSCMAKDLNKIFDVYWRLGKPNATVPDSRSKWPPVVDTEINGSKPVNLTFHGPDLQSALVYLSSSPASFCPLGRTVDIDAILSVINDAREFVYIAVMDYFPTSLYGCPRIFWSAIDDALRTAAFDRNVSVHVLASWWDHSRPDIVNYLHSLSSFHSQISTKLFHVPATEEQAKIPFARVNHNKYMVTDRIAYIGTSNWSFDYFNSTGGVGVILNQTDTSGGSMRAQLEAVFERDWSSQYARPVPDGPTVPLKPCHHY